MNYIMVAELGVVGSEYCFDITALDLSAPNRLSLHFVAGSKKRPEAASSALQSTAQQAYTELVKKGALEIAHPNLVNGLPGGTTAIQSDKEIIYLAEQMHRMVNQGKGYGRNPGEIHTLKRFASRFAGSAMFRALRDIPEHTRLRIEEDAIIEGDDSCERRIELYGILPSEQSQVLW